MKRAIAGSVLCMLLAGCFSAPDPTPTASSPWFTDPLRPVGTHDHRDPSQHQASLNMSLVAHHALTDQAGESARTHSVDRCDHWLALGRAKEGDYGVDIVDVSDPARPQWVGRYRDANAVPADRDVAWSADCDWIFMANGGSNADSSGVRIINARDKARPVFESLYRVPAFGVGGTPASVAPVHTVYALAVGPLQYVYALNYGVHILRLERGLDGKMGLALLGRYVAPDVESMLRANTPSPDATATRRTIYGHDMAVYEEAGRIMLYVAYAYAGLKIVDITDPARPKELSGWVPPGPGVPHYVHSVRVYDSPGLKKRLAVVGAESFEARHADLASPLWILDVTDRAAPRHLASWANPSRVGSDHLLFSLHFYEVEGDRLWLTHYHGGVWVIDLLETIRLFPAQGGGVSVIEHAASPTEVKAMYLPHEDTGYQVPESCCSGFKLAGVPMSVDVKVHEGTAFVADMSTGLYVLRATDQAA